MLFAPVLLALAVQTPAQTSTTLADLVPKGTVVFVQSPSLERAAKFVERLGNAFGPTDGQTVDVAKLLAMIELHGDAAAVDAARPVGVCLVLGEGGEPLPAYLIPVRDADAFLKSIQQPGSPMKGVAKGGYACIGFGAAPELPSAPAAIAKGLPEGEIALRLDAGRLIEQFHEQIDAGLDQIESMNMPSTAGIDPKPMMGAYVGFLRDFVDSAETLDLAVHLDGDNLELGMALVNAEKSALANFGSKEKTGVRALGSLLDPDASVGALIGMDMAAMTKRFQPLFDVLPDMYPEGLRPAMKQMFGHLGEFYGLLGNSMAASFDFGPNGMRYSAFVDCKDPAKLLGLYRDMLKGVPGVAAEELPARELDGAKVAGLQLKLDLAAIAKLAGGKEPQGAELGQVDEMLKKLFGPEGMSVRVATKEGKTALVIGGGDEYLHTTLARMSSKSAAPAFVSRGLAQVGDLNPCFVIRYDIGRLMKGLQEITSVLAPNTAIAMIGLPISITAWGGVDGRTWRGALATNLSEISAMVRAESAPKPSGPTKAKVDITAIMNALDAYAINNSGKYPDSLEPLVTPDANGASYLEGYAGKIPKDPWNKEYRYDPPKQGRPKPRVYSYGSDVAPGGTGDAADIDSDKLGDGR